LLTDPGTGQILALERGVSVIRTLRVSRLSAPFEPHQPLRVLALFSGADDLDLASERRMLEKVGREVRGLKVEVEPATDLSGLEDRLAGGLGGRPYQVLHLAGHGKITAGPRGGVLAWNPPGKAPMEVAGRALSTLLRRTPDLGLVVVNACSTADLPGGSGDPFAGLAAALLQGGIPAVVAVQGAIRDEAAVAFSRAFYAGLAAGASPEEAMARARWALWKAEPEGLEWAKPVLFQGATPRRLAPWLRRTAAGLVLALALLSALALVQQTHLATRTLQRRVADARTLLQSDRSVEASRVLEGALASRAWPRPSPETLASAHSTAALAAQDLGHLTRAISHAAEAVRLEPDRAVYRYNLGALLARSGRSGEAASHLRRALALDPGLAKASNELGCVELALGRTEQARRVLEEGIANTPRNPLLHKNLGRALLASGHPAQAARSIERALALLPAADWPERAEVSFWLARVAAERQDDSETCRALEKFRAADPQGVTQWVPEASFLARAARCPGATSSSPAPTGGPSAR
jgi:tetratricopeptide (TPR) repeat protein